jgi:hypothetical protein
LYGLVEQTNAFVHKQHFINACRQRGPVASTRVVVEVEVRNIERLLHLPDDVEEAALVEAVELDRNLIDARKDLVGRSHQGVPLPASDVKLQNQPLLEIAVAPNLRLERVVPLRIHEPGAISGTLDVKIDLAVGTGRARGIGAVVGVGDDSIARRDIASPIVVSLDPVGICRLEAFEQVPAQQVAAVVLAADPFEGAVLEGDGLKLLEQGLPQGPFAGRSPRGGHPRQADDKRQS